MCHYQWRRGWTSTLLTDTVFTITTFGQDDAGELYVSRYATNGAIYRIVGHDSVGDGIADWWRQQYFGAPITTNNALERIGRFVPRNIPADY